MTTPIPAAAPASPKPRLHFLDASRAYMLLLGVPLHSSEVYRISGGFHIDSPDNSIIAAFLSGLIHSFRMQAFFLISGFFAAMVISRRGRNMWFQGRWRRLAIPLLAGSFLLGPVELMLQVYYNSGAHHLDPSVVFDYPLWKLIRHRWFLLVLLIFCTLLWAIWAFSTRWMKYVDRFAALALPCTALHWGVLMVGLVASSFGSIAAGKLLGDMLFDAEYLKRITIFSVGYLPFFLIGVVVFLADKMEQLCTLSRVEKVIAIAVLGVYLVTYFAFYPADFDDRFVVMAKVLKIARLLVAPVAAYFGARLFLSIMAALFKDRNTVINYLVDAALCIYLFHMLFVIVITGYLLDKPYNANLELLVSIVGATALSILTYEVVKRSRILSWAFNGKEWDAKSVAPQPRPGDPA